MTALFAVTIHPESGLYDVGSCSKGMKPVHSYSPVHPGTGIVPSPAARMGIRPGIW